MSKPTKGDSKPLLGDSNPVKGEVGLYGVGCTRDASSTEITVLLFFHLFMAWNELFLFLERSRGASSTERTVLKFLLLGGKEESLFLEFDLVSLPVFETFRYRRQRVVR